MRALCAAVVSGLFAVSWLTGCAHDVPRVASRRGADAADAELVLAASAAPARTADVADADTLVARWQGKGKVAVLADDLPGPEARGAAAHARFPRKTSRLVSGLQPGPLDRPWRASVWVRAADGAGSRDVRLALLDGTGERALGPAVRPAAHWTRLAVEVDPRLDGPPPPAFVLEPGELRADGPAGFTLALPEAWAAFGSDAEAPRRSRARLLEDGAPLGPGNALHASVRDEGAGAYSHWGAQLWFSTSDGSDPRTNRRRYELRLDPAELQGRWRGPLELQVLAEPGEGPLELLVTDGELEPLAG